MNGAGRRGRASMRLRAQGLACSLMLITMPRYEGFVSTCYHGIDFLVGLEQNLSSESSYQRKVNRE